MHLFTLVLLSLAIPAYTSAHVNPPQVICGTLRMADGTTKPLVSGACWPIAGQAVAATVDDAYSCNFSIWDSCDAGRAVKRGRITGVKVSEARGYWCSRIQ